MRLSSYPKYFTLLITSTLIFTQGCNVFGRSVDANPNPDPTAIQPTFVIPVLPNQSVSTETPQPTLTVPTLLPDYGLVWQARFETGDISEVLLHGDFIRQGISASYNLVSPHAHTGKYSVGLTIDTTAPSETGAQSAYLFFWDYSLVPDIAYYYSAWYYIPSSIKPAKFWNIWQFLSKDIDGEGIPRFNIYIVPGDDGLDLELHQRTNPENSDERIKYKQDIIHIPQDKWFQIESYYKKAQDLSGQVVVWLDGVEIFNIVGVQTVYSSTQVFWAVNNYSDHIEPNPCTIYIDDMFISKKRIGPVSLPLP